MPLSAKNMPTLECSACHEQVALPGIFRICGDTAGGTGIKKDDPVCFACVFIYTLSGTTCCFCGGGPCGAFLAVQAEGSDRVAPAAICPACLQDRAMEGEERVVSDQGRGLVPELPWRQ